MAKQRKQRKGVPADEVQMRLSVRVAELRATRGMTQLELAKKASVALQYITKIEQGDRAPSLRTLAMLAAALEVPVFELFNFEQREITRPRVEGQILRLRAMLGKVPEEDVKLLNKIAERLAGAPPRR